MEARRAGAGISLPEDDTTFGALARRLPEDILFHVLTWLPAKSLCRLRCVSRRWRAIISEPAFAAAHGRRAGAAPLVIGVFEGPRKLATLERLRAGAPLYGRTLELRVMDATDGGRVVRVVKDVGRRRRLRLPRARLDLARLDAELCAAAAVDPATGRAVAIRGFVDDPKAGHVSICYDGFGRAAPSGVYKAVRLVHSSMEAATAHVATLDGGGSAAAADELAWRRGPATPFLPCGCSWCTPTVDGVIYFMPHGVHGFAPGRNRVAAFDLETEEWRKPVIEGPEEEGLWQIALVELRGALSMVHSEGPSCQTNIWFLVDSDKSVWVKKHVIQMHKTWSLIVKPLDVLSDGRVLLLNLVEKKQEQNSRYYSRWVLQLHDPSTGAHKDVMEIDPLQRQPRIISKVGFGGYKPYHNIQLHILESHGIS